MTVSVVIPCYNQGHLLSQAIESALHQSRPPDEVVVVDDGSTDMSAPVCRKYGARITYIHQENAGLSAARNTGIRSAASEYIQFLDADDMLRPTALEYLVESATNNPTAAVFRASWDEIDQHGSVTARVTGAELGPDPYHALFDPIAVGPPCRYMVRRSVLLDVGLFDAELQSCEDWDMWLRIALAGNQFVTSQNAVVVYRRHSESMSRNHKRMWRSGAKVLRRARTRHGCDVCTSAYWAGLASWREYCYLSILRADVRAAIRARRFGYGLVISARAIRYDPPVAKLLVSSALRNLGVVDR
jgi:glycosyltransferase involved in cell wall biosynthesis